MKAIDYRTPSGIAAAIRTSEETYTVTCRCLNCGWIGRKTFPRGTPATGRCPTCDVYGIARTR